MTDQTGAGSFASAGPSAGAPTPGPFPADFPFRLPAPLVVPFSPDRRTARPFVFRSGGLFGPHQAQSVRQAILYMDRHPADGMAALQNGTLAAWLDQEGAGEMAEAARAARRATRDDPRMALETFLLATGLVPRPRLSVRPATVDLGYVTSGQVARRHLRLRLGRGRGYLSGHLERSEPWVGVRPPILQGGALDAVVSVDTEALPLRDAPYEAALYVHANASAQPVAIPVRLRVVPLVAPLSRYLLRPLAGLIDGLLLGAAAGAALEHWGIPAAAWFGPGSDPLLVPLSWTALIGLLWAFLAALRGFFQPPAWPSWYASARWMGCIAACGSVFVALAALVFWWWRQPLAAAPWPVSPRLQLSLLFLSLILAAFPATLNELVAARSFRDSPILPVRRWPSRSLLQSAAVALTIALLLCAAPLAHAAWQRPGVQQAAALVEAHGQDGWTRLDRAAHATLDRLYLHAYDRRAAPKAQP